MNVLDEFDPIAGEEAWKNLELYHNKIACWVQKCISKGVEPREIYRKVIDTWGIDGDKLARKCKLAAQHLGAEKE